MDKIFALLIFLALAGCSSSQVPKCDDPEVLTLANQALRNAPLIKALENSKMKIGDFQNPGEVEYDSNKDHRVCRVQVKDTDGSEVWLKFKVSWHNKKESQIFVEFIQ